MAKSKRAPPGKDTAYSAAEEAVNRSYEIGPRAPKGTFTMKINLSNVSTTFEPRKAGEYEGTLVGHVLNPASATSGQPTLRLEWVEKDDPSSHMFKTYSLQPKALWSLKRDLLRVGASVEAMNDPEADIEEIVRSLYGYVSTIKYGDPRPDANDPTKLYDNFLEIVDPKKLS
jgi:hypothetical protein